MIICVSDVHLGYTGREDIFYQFLDEVVAELNPWDYFIMCGDIIEFWRRRNIDVLREANTLFEKLSKLKCRIVYIYGNHDVMMRELRAGRADVWSDFMIDKYHFTHGHVVEALLMELSPSEYEAIAMDLCKMEDVLGALANAMYTLATKVKETIEEILEPAERRPKLTEVDRLAREPAVKAMLGADVNEWLIFGHTHRAYVDENSKTANCGNWIEDSTYITIEDGKVHLKRF